MNNMVLPSWIMESSKPSRVVAYLRREVWTGKKRCIELALPPQGAAVTLMLRTCERLETVCNAPMRCTNAATRMTAVLTRQLMPAQGHGSPGFKNLVTMMLA